MPYEEMFTALSHPLRQQILDALRVQPASVRELTDGLTASQPVVSQHLKVLRDAGLVSARAEGTRRIYSVETEGLRQLRLFLEQRWRGVIEAVAEDKDA